MVKPRDPPGWDRVDLLIFLDNNKAQNHHKKLSSKHNTERVTVSQYNP